MIVKGKVRMEKRGRLKLDTGEILYRGSDAVLEQLPREAVDAPSIPGRVQGQVR